MPEWWWVSRDTDYELSMVGLFFVYIFVYFKQLAPSGGLFLAKMEGYKTGQKFSCYSIVISFNLFLPVTIKRNETPTGEC